MLARRYEECYGAQISSTTLGQSPLLEAAIVLLWDVLWVVDVGDTEGPVVAVRDTAALTRQPGQLGCWPFLYQVLCSIVMHHGAPDVPAANPQLPSGREVACNMHSLLVSRLRPLLECHWNVDFEESSIGFWSEDGTFTRLKKMKHLLLAVVRWRVQRQAWQRRAGFAPSAVDAVLIPSLEVAPAKKHNDLMLRCSVRRGPAAAALTCGTSTARMFLESDPSMDLLLAA